MNNSAIEMVQNNYEQFGKGNPAPLLASLSENVSWRVSGGSPLAGEYVGKSDVMRFFGRMMELYGGSLQLEIIDVLLEENHVAAMTEEQFSYKEKPVRFRSVHLYEMKNNLIVSFEAYYDDYYHKFWPLDSGKVTSSRTPWATHPLDTWPSRGGLVQGVRVAALG